MSDVSKHAMGVLKQFADEQYPASRHEVFGDLKYPANAKLDAAIEELRAASMLVALPTDVTADTHGGTRYEVSAKGKILLRLAVPQMPTATSGGRVASLNGKRRRVSA